jgi:hypothetical protein
MRWSIGAGLTLLLVTTAAVRAGDGPIIGADPRPAPDGPCVEVEIGGERASSLACLNLRLKREVERVQPAANTPPLDAASSAVRVGGIDEAAVRQQLGSNFGKSVVPQRPPPPVFAAPLGRRP